MPDREFIIKVSMPAGDFSGAQAAQVAQEAIAKASGLVTSATEQASQATGRFTDAAGRLREANGRFVEMGNSAQNAGKQIGDASHEADHFLESLKAGVSIDIGHRLVEGIAEIPRAFQEAIQEGVAFNAEMEKLAINFGSAMRASDPAKFLSFAEARQAGVEALETIRQKANQLGLDFAEVAHGFSINLAALREGGVKDTQQQIDLIVRLNQITAAKGIGGQQSQRDIIDLLQGRGDRTIFGKELEPLGITNESIKQAREMGTLADLILTKTQAYGEAAAASADTFGAAQQRLKNETEQLYGEIARPVFDELKEQYQLLAAEITKPEVAEALKSLGYDLASVVEAGGGLIRFAIENASVLVPLGAAIGAVTFALSAYKAAQIASIIGAKLTSIVAETEATAAHAATVAADTAAVEANTVAREAGAGIGAAGIGGTIALGLLPGAAIYAMRQHEADQEGERDQEVGEESSAHTDQAGKYYQDIQRATTDEEKLKLRKQLTDDLAASKARLTELEQTESEAQKDAADNGTGFSSLDDPKRSGQIDALREYVSELDKIIERFNILAGKKPLPDLDGKKEDDALARYKASPEYRLSQAEASGDQQGVDDAQYDAQVDKRRTHLEKTYGLNPDAAEQTAQTEVSADDQRKQDEEAAKEKARDDEKAKREADQAASEAKQRSDAIQSEQEEIDIASARAKGENDVADKLEKQRDLRREITRLQTQGLSYAEAQALAEQKITAENAEQDRKDADHAARHQHRGGGGDGPVTTYGYSDPVHDAPGQLHTGRLQTSTLDGSPSVDRFAGVPDSAAAALAAAPTAAAALANAPSYVPSFATPFNPLAGLLNPLSAPTAAAALAPGFGTSGSSQPGGASAGGGGGDAAQSLSGVASSADNAKSGLDQLAGVQSAAQSVSQSLGSLASSLQGVDLAGTLSDFQSQLDALQSTVDNLNSGG